MYDLPGSLALAVPSSLLGERGLAEKFVPGWAKKLLEGSEKIS